MLIVYKKAVNSNALIDLGTTGQNGRKSSRTQEDRERGRQGLYKNISGGTAICVSSFRVSNSNNRGLDQCTTL